MFIGHFGIGFGAKKLAPQISLGVLFIVTQFLDLLWPVLLLLDIEHVRIAPGITKLTPLDFFDYPISHSLALVVFWALICALLTQLFTKKSKYAFIIFACVLSHWFLDLIVHRPDLPLMPGSDLYVGLGLWNSVFLTILIELILFLGGAFIYGKSTIAKNNFGKYGLIALILLFLIIQTANMTGPPPPDVNVIAWAGNLQWLFVILAFYVDKNRKTV